MNADNRVKIVSVGALHPLVTLLRSSERRVQEQALGALRGAPACIRPICPVQPLISSLNAATFGNVQYYAWIRAEQPVCSLLLPFINRIKFLFADLNPVTCTPYTAHPVK